MVMKRLLKTYLTLLVFLLITIGFAQTTIEVRFIESAPKDSFVITNTGSCDLGEFSLTINLTETKGKLIFDTSEAGAGVEVFQPFEVVKGDIQLESSEAVSDGDSVLTVRIGKLAADASASFTIDLDDTLVNSDLGMIRVTNSEIENAIAVIVTPEEEVFASVFDDTSRAIIPLTNCF